MSEKIESLLKAHEVATNFFYQLIRVEGSEQYLEVRFRDGIRTAFAYDKLAWFNLSPETRMLDLDFMGTTVSFEGRGLDELFNALKGRKISWIREADTELQDNDSNTIYIKEITITPPDDGLESENESA